MPSLFLSLCISAIYLGYLILKSTWMSPLNTVKNAHLTSPFCSLWILCIRYRGREPDVIRKLHERHGPLLRLGPNELSLACVENGSKTVLERPFEKSVWYERFCNYNRTPSLFTFLDHKSHFQRRRAVMGVFTQSFLQNNQEIQSLVETILLRRYLPIIRDHADRKAPLDIRESNDAAAFDFITSYIFGSSVGTNLLENSSFRQTFLGHHYKERSQGFWKHEVPFLASLVRRLGFDVTTKSAKWMQDWFSHSYQLSQANLRKEDSGTRAVLLEHLLGSPHMAPHSRAWNVDLAVISEAHDHGVAGAETTSQVITNAMLALSRRPSLQDDLRTELLSSLPSTTRPMRPVELGRLPLLHAVVIETLRHRDPGPFPRIAPHQIPSIAGCQNIPQGTKVTVYSHVIHRDPRMFPAPDDWDPSRWLSHLGLGFPERCGEIGMSFLAFGGGDRTCVGRDFAMFEIKALLAAVYSTYKTRLADEAVGPHKRPQVTEISPKKMRVIFERA